MTRFVIYPAIVSNEEAHFLKNDFIKKGYKALIAKRDGVYSPKAGDVVIDWGYSKPANWDVKAREKASLFLNRPEYILNAVDKLAAYELLKECGVRTISFARSKAVVEKWLNNGHKVIGRKTLTGKKAEGAVLIESLADVVDCPLYTKFVPSTNEFRVYVMGGDVFDVIEKRRKQGTNDSGAIKSEDNGWVFCRQHVSLPTQCAGLAVMAVKALGLDFGGVDVLWDAEKGRATILEVNTAPGIFGSGVGKFAEAFIQLSEEA